MRVWKAERFPLVKSRPGMSLFFLSNNGPVVWNCKQKVLCAVVTVGVSFVFSFNARFYPKTCFYVKIETLISTENCFYVWTKLIQCITWDCTAFVCSWISNNTVNRNLVMLYSGKFFCLDFIPYSKATFWRFDYFIPYYFLRPMNISRIAILDSRVMSD